MKTLITNDCNKYLNQIQELVDERNALFNELNQAENTILKNYIRQTIRLINREIARLRNLHQLCLENSIPKPDLFCKKQTVEKTLETLSPNLISIEFNQSTSSFKWAAVIYNKGNTIVQGPFNMIIGLDYTSNEGLSLYREKNILIPNSVQIEPDNRYITEFMPNVDRNQMPYTFYIQLDLNKVIKEQNEYNNTVEYHIPSFGS